MTTSVFPAEKDSPASARELARGALVLRHEGPLSVLTLNRPDRYNALNRDMASGLLEAAREASARADCRVLLVHGAGPGFCAGGDVAFVASHFPHVEGAIREFLAEFHEFLALLKSMDPIVITAVHGSAAGAGFSLALMGDLCVASADARFVPAYGKLGVSPDCGGSVGVPEAVGTRRAMQIFLLEREIDARKAEQWGLVNDVCEPGTLMERARELGNRIADLSPEACRQTKSLFRRGNVHLADQLTAEVEALVQCAQTERYRSAVRSFLERSA